MATPSVYQRVGNAAVTPSDYDSSVGKVYLRFNGTNQWLQTNSIDFTYGDKMFVSAGVRKLSDPAVGMITELSSSWSSNAGSFALYTEYGGPGPRYAMASRGTAAAVQAQVAEYLSSSLVAPITNIISSQNDIAGDLTTLRVDGVQRASAVVDKGTGNFGNYPMFVGARAGTSFWFNGRLYQMVVAGKQASAAEITSTETYINQKTGAF